MKTAAVLSLMAISFVLLIVTEVSADPHVNPWLAVPGMVLGALWIPAFIWWAPAPVRQPSREVRQPARAVVLRRVTRGPRLFDDSRYAAMRAGQEVNDASDATEEWTADHPRVGDTARRVPVGARPTV